MHRGMGGARCERGFVVAEAAFVIPAVIAVAVSGIALLSIAMTTLGLQEIARSSARDIARGVPSHSVQASVHASQPQTTVTVTPTPQGVAVTVHREVRIAGGWFGGLAVPLQREVLVPWEAGIGVSADGVEHAG